MKRLYLLFFAVLFSFVLLAQDKKTDKKIRTELGLNITNTLAGFFNSGGSNLSVDEYLFSLKIGNRKGAMRFATNFNTRSNSEFLVTGTRDLRENEVFLRGGYEFRRPVEKGFMLYYGLDGVLELEFEEVNFNSFSNENINSLKTTTGFGGGPILGIQYFISKRVALSTEASIYGLVQYREEKQDVGSGLPPVENQTTGFRVAPVIPSSLYLIMIF